MTQTTTGIEVAPFDPFTMAQGDDAHDAFRTYRQLGPVHDSAIGLPMCFRYKECVAILHDRRLSANPANLGAQNEHLDGLRGLARLRHGDARILLLSDGDDHARLRHLVAPAFSRANVERWSDMVAEIVDQLLTPLRRGHPFEVMQSIAFPLPILVICQLLGVPTEDRPLFREWTPNLSRLMDPLATANAHRELRQGLMSGLRLLRYVERLVDRRLDEGLGDDLISILLASEVDDDRLSRQELLSTVALLLAAGHETTMNLIGNGLHALLRHDDQWRRLVEDASLVEGAVEEVVRYDSPVAAVIRTATEPVEIGDRTIEAGGPIVGVIASANRDPEVFEDPDRLDITRSAPGHLAFGHGAHFCIGTWLAQLECATVFRELATRFPDIRETAPATYRPHLVFRGLESLEVTA